MKKSLAIVRFVADSLFALYFLFATLRAVGMVMGSRGMTAYSAGSIAGLVMAALLCCVLTWDALRIAKRLKPPAG
jgi:hypothetical protein